MGLRGRDSIELKTDEQFALMREAGLLVARTLQMLADAASAGVTTAELDRLAHDMIRDHGGVPSFLGYHGYPSSICASVNSVVVHGIPGERALQDGDLLSIDCGAIVEGWHGDAAVSVMIGEVSHEVRKLSEDTEDAMWAGLRQARPGRRLTDISHAIEQSLRNAGEYGIVEDYGGHGIGTSMHMNPHILNHGRPGRGPKLQPGMALAIEPMAVLGDAEVGVLSDGWTVVTSDGSHAAHWEHTVAITEDGPWVLTALDDVRL